MNFPHLITALLTISAVVGATLAYLIPWLWGVVKPYIHAFTA